MKNAATAIREPLVLSRRRLLAGGTSLLASAVVGRAQRQLDASELHYTSLVDVAASIRRREVSPVELTRAQLDRIDRLEPSRKAFAMVLPERALREARTAEEEIQAGNYRGPLHGIPIAVKDLMFTAGLPTRGGSGALADHVPSYDGTVVRRLAGAGAVLLGKLNTTEGAMTGYHRDFEVPRNPWGDDLFPGFSSSGSGVATAAGLCYGSLGTDTGGSIRYPCAANGLVGLKPTWGRVSRYGVLGLAPSLDHVGPMTRTVADAAAMLAVLAGSDENDPTSLPDNVSDYLGEIRGGLQGLRVGFDPEYGSNGVEVETVAAVEEATQVLEQLGGRLVRVQMPAFDSRHQDAWVTICSAEAAAEHARTFPSRAGQYGTYFRSFLERGSQSTGVEYARANVVRQELSGAIRRVFRDIDVLACPSVAYKGCRYDPVDAYGGTVFDRVETLSGVPTACLSVSSRFTMPFNFCGYPTLSLPCGFSREGWPLSLQLVGHPLSEALLCRAGHAYEESTGWHTRHPVVGVG